MFGDFDEDEDPDFEPDFDDDGYCENCGGDGWILDCPDDICHGVGYCIHGDGMRICECNTNYEPPSEAPADWKPPRHLGIAKRKRPRGGP